MRKQDRYWALVLAAGSGTRLSSLTRIGDSGSVPKQFWSLAGGASLLEETLERAGAIASAEQTIVVVAAEHESHWSEALAGLPERNIIVQPQNRGTAIGILLGVTAIFERDCNANIAVLPSDHFVGDEPVLRRAIVKTLRSLDREPSRVSFLGIRPESADPGLGYIVRGGAERDGSYRIAEFVEKPSIERARELVARSALWNSFILVGRASAFRELIARRHPALVETMRTTVRRAFAEGPFSPALTTLYAELPCSDFSHDVVEGAESGLKVVPVPACGWSDLGTPTRVVECLGRLGERALARGMGPLSLAAAHSRLQQENLVVNWT